MSEENWDWVEIKKLKAENARLNAEVEQIRKAVDEHLTPIPEHTTVMEVERLCTAWSLMSNSLDAQWKRIEQLKAEVQRLKSLCDNLGMGGKHTVTAIADENARLKAEVERLRSSSFVTAVPIEQYERLRKAGDAMALTLANADRMEYGDHSEPIEEYMNREVIVAWNSAKEGKQP